MHAAIHAEEPRFPRRPLSSSLAGVSDEAWNQFVRVMSVQAIGAISASGGYGSFELRPRRLAELGFMTNLRSARRGDRQVQEGDFVAPLSAELVLRNPLVQYHAFCRSIEGYDKALATGELARPEGVSRSGALAILHRGGSGALHAWPQLFDDTRALYERAKDLF